MSRPTYRLTRAGRVVEQVGKPTTIGGAVMVAVRAVAGGEPEWARVDQLVPASRRAVNAAKAAPGPVAA